MNNKRTLYFSHEQASARLHYLGDDTYALSNLWSETRGRGHASAVMRQITRYADHRMLTIKVIAQPYGHPHETALSRKDLEAFYERYGFSRDSHIPPVKMTRQPSRG